MGLELHGSAAPEHGQATVSIDGGAPVLVDQYAADPADGVEFFESPPLADGEHVATLTVLNQRQDAAVDDLVTIDKAVVTQVLAADGPAGGTLSEPDLEGAEPDDARGTASDGARGSVLDDGRGAVLRESGDGAATSLYATTSTNDVHPLWHVEPGSEPVARTRGSITKVGGDRFHRMFSKQRFGGPGKTLTIAYRARATEIRDRSGSSIVEGAKIGLKWPVDRSLTGYDEDDPRSVHGTSSQGDRSSPGSYAFLTGLTEEGYLELARNGYGSDEYTFFPNESVGYTPGTWKDIVVKVDWQVDRSIRVRFWHNAHATGKPVYDVTDERSPFWSEPGFLWLRTDDTDFEYDSITVRECEVGC